MELWHLDYEKSVERGVDRHLALTLSTGGAEAAENAAQAFRAGFYYKVALVDDAVPPGRTFMLTQHVEDDWSEVPPEGITPTGEGPFRSTSNGDVLIGENGHFVMTSGGLVKFVP
jgi:hypothetical protein